MGTLFSARLSSTMVQSQLICAGRALGSLVLGLMDGGPKCTMSDPLGDLPWGGGVEGRQHV